MSNERSKPTTLEGIAKIAGVNRRTVRDALQGTGRVAPATREKVRRIALELRYEPNLVARALVTGKTGRISILISSLDHPYNVLVVRHLVHALTKNGYEAVIIQEHAYMPNAQTLRSSFSDGMIVVGMQFVNGGDSEKGVIRGSPSGEPILPFVIIDAQRPQFMDHVTVDISLAVKESIRLMLASGRKRIAYVNKQVLDPDDQEVRYRTYLNLVTEAGLKPEIIVADDQLVDEERIKILKAYFQKHGAPGAIFCHNDQIAIFTYQVLRDLGYDIPKDTLLCGCDGIEYVNYLDTPVSTITAPWEEVSEMACEFLKKRIHDPSIPRQEHVVEGKLEVRKSLISNDHP